MKTYLDVLNETITFYSEDVNRRSINDTDNCMYNGPDGKQCAIGRVCNDIPEKFEDKLCDTIFDQLGFNILKPEYNHLKNYKFWLDLQAFHDDEDNWDEDGLSLIGYGHYEKLKNEYKNK